MTIKYSIKVLYKQNWIYVGDSEGIFLFDTELERNLKKVELKKTKYILE